MTRDSFSGRLVRAWMALAIVDLCWAVVLSLSAGRPAMSAFQGVANVALARGSVLGLTPSVPLGTLLHFGVALWWSSLFLVVESRTPWLQRLLATRRGQALAATTYGPFIWITMSRLVIPFMTGRTGAISAQWFVQLVGHIFFVGAPVIWGARRPRGAASARP